jgi:hypothetical protein
MRINVLASKGFTRMQSLFVSSDAVIGALFKNFFVIIKEKQRLDNCC